MSYLRAGYSTSNRILTSPELPEFRISPNKTFVYSLAIVLGFIIGLGLNGVSLFNLQ